MEVLNILIPLAILFVLILVAIFFWAVKNGQFDDLEGPALRILLDNEEINDKNKDKDKDKDKDKNLSNHDKTP